MSEKRTVTEVEWAYRRKLAIMCRIVGTQGSIGVFGHISIRIPDTDLVLVTPGAGSEKTTVCTDDIFVFDINGKMLHHPGGDDRPIPTQIPAEWRIHTQIHKDRPETLCVAHLHAYHSTLLGIAGREIRPVYSQGHIIKDGIPTWDNPLLVVNDELAIGLSKALGKSVACQMRGHGSVVVGDTPELCLQACTFIEENARFQIDAQALGGAVPFPSELWGGMAVQRAKSPMPRLLWDYWERRVVSGGPPL